MTASVELPRGIVQRVRRLCMALPEVTVRVDYPRTWSRSTAHSFEIRRRSFCLLVAAATPSGKTDRLLILRADVRERERLLSIGTPFFSPPRIRDRIGVLLSDKTDWAEIGELVTDSYRVVAPKKLTALLD